MTHRAMNQESLHQQAQRVLEWHALLDLLARQAQSSRGAERCRSLSLETTLEAAQEKLRETTEMVMILESDHPMPTLNFQDLRAILDRSRKGAILEGIELRALSSMLGMAHEAKVCVSGHQSQAPLLWQRMGTMNVLGELKHSIDQCVDAEGNMMETATPTLHDLIQEANGLKHRIRRRLETILSSQRLVDVLQEQYFVQRESRYVLPVKADMQSKLPGIVHDVSASGATVFVEPREFVELNNRIKVADIQIVHEIKRILTELSKLVSAQHVAITHILEILGELDCLGAKARLSRMMNGHPVDLNEQGRIIIRGARHPLLVIAKDRVVPQDLVLKEDARVLVISGPNTGGKTVVLKLLGLFACMVRSGLPPPCAEGSEMGIFPEVYADIGDAQDLTQDLSSFSAHLMTLIRILEAARTVRPPGSSHVLVLLDEIGGSTDPTEGAALAEVLLQRLSELGVKVMVTTHYNALKLLAPNMPGFVNASLEFDTQTLAPTYRLIQGLPGGSSAIDIAGRLGMERAILDQALMLVHPEDRRLNDLIQELQGAQSRLNEERTLLLQRRLEAERSAAEAKEITERLQTTEREEAKKTKKRLNDALAHAKSDIQAILQEAKQERSSQKSREAKQILTEIARNFQDQHFPKMETIPIEKLRVGDSVEITSVGTMGTLLELPHGKRRVRIQVGNAELSVDISSLVGRGQSTTVDMPPYQESCSRTMPSSQHNRSDPSSTFFQRQPNLTAFATVDLRGHMVEEALEELMRAIDQAVLNEARVLRVIHGHGTGRLKSAVRSYCATSPEASRFRPGVREEGGDGVTIVDLSVP